MVESLVQEKQYFGIFIINFFDYYYCYDYKDLYNIVYQEFIYF